MACSLECRSHRTNPPAHSDVRMTQSEQGMGVGKLGIDLNCLFEIDDRGVNVFLGHSVVGGKRAQVMIPCVEIVRSLPPCAGDLGQRDLRPDRCRYAGDNVVLQFKEIANLSVVALRPDMTIGLRIDQLRANSNPITGSAHATFQDIADTELAPHPSYVDGFALVSKGGVPRDDTQPFEARESRR